MQKGAVSQPERARTARRPLRAAARHVLRAVTAGPSRQTAAETLPAPTPGPARARLPAEGSPAEARRCRRTPTALPAARPPAGAGAGGEEARCCPRVPPSRVGSPRPAALPGQLQQQAAHADPPRRPGGQHRRQLRQLDHGAHRPGAPVGQGQQRRRHPAALRARGCPERGTRAAVRRGAAWRRGMGRGARPGRPSRSAHGGRAARGVGRGGRPACGERRAGPGGGHLPLPVRLPGPRRA